MTYEEFIIRFAPGSDPQRFQVEVRSPAGEVSFRLELPEELFEEVGRFASAVDARRHLEPALGGSQHRRHSARQMGGMLFRSLFREDVLNLYERTCGQIGIRSRAGLRIRLDLDPRRPGLRRVAALPWEYLFREERGEFLGLSRWTPIVRFLEVPHPSQDSELPSRLRIVALRSEPRELPKLHLGEELDLLRRVCRYNRSLELVVLERPTLEALREAFLEAPVHVLHYMGHARFDDELGEGCLLLEDGERGSLRVSGADLSTELRDFQHLRLVFLNSCETGVAGGVAASLLSGGVPAVIAMQLPISDRGAIQLAQTTYARISHGDPVDAAVVEGRLALRRGEHGAAAEWGTPVLFTRRSDGRLFFEAGPKEEERRARLLRSVPLAAATVAGLVGLAGLLGGPFQRSNPPEDIGGEAQLSQTSPPDDPCYQEGIDGVEHLTSRALTLLQQGEIAEARPLLDRALERAPGSGLVHTISSGLAEREGRHLAALHHARAATEALPDCPRAFFNLGSLYFGLGRHEAALGPLEAALSLDASYVAARNELANVYLALERPEDARMHLREALLVEPETPSLHKNLARTALAEGAPEEAIERLERAAGLYPPEDWRSQDEVAYWLAEAHVMNGERLEACSCLSRFGGRGRPPLTPWERRAMELGERLGCVVAHPLSEGAR